MDEWQVSEVNEGSEVSGVREGSGVSGVSGMGEVSVVWSRREERW